MEMHTHPIHLHTHGRARAQTSSLSLASMLLSSSSSSSSSYSISLCVWWKVPKQNRKCKFIHSSFYDCNSLVRNIHIHTHTSALSPARTSAPQIRDSAHSRTQFINLNTHRHCLSHHSPFSPLHFIYAFDEDMYLARSVSSTCISELNDFYYLCCAVRCVHNVERTQARFDFLCSHQRVREWGDWRQIWNKYYIFRPSGPLSSLESEAKNEWIRSCNSSGDSSKDTWNGIWPKWCDVFFNLFGIKAYHLMRRNISKVNDDIDITLSSPPSPTLVQLIRKWTAFVSFFARCDPNTHPQTFLRSKCDTQQRAPSIAMILPKGRTPSVDLLFRNKCSAIEHRQPTSHATTLIPSNFSNTKRTTTTSSASVPRTIAATVVAGTGREWDCARRRNTRRQRERERKREKIRSNCYSFRFTFTVITPHYIMFTGFFIDMQRWRDDRKKIRHFPFI